MKRYYCTYFDRNYLVKGVAMLESLVRCEKRSFTVFVVCLDEISRVLITSLQIPNVVTVPFHAIEEDDFALLATKSKRTLVEYYWTATPTILLRILERHPEIDVLTYLDADLYFYSSPDPIFDELGLNSVLIHEHRFPPRLAPLARYGKYNVGLLSFRNDHRGLRVLNWWRDRCLEWCYAHQDGEKFGDQAYLNNWTTQFEGVAVLQHPGAGLGPWNHEQYQFTIGGNGQVFVSNLPVVFYHFHSLLYLEPEIIIPTADRSYFISEKIIHWVFVPYAEALLAGLGAVRAILPDFSFGLGMGNRQTNCLRMLVRTPAVSRVRQNYPNFSEFRITGDWVLLVDKNYELASPDNPFTVEAPVAPDRGGQQTVFRSRQEIEEALRANPNSPNLWAMLGAQEFEAGKYIEAEKLLKRAAELNPAAPHFCVDLALVYLKLNQIPAFEKALGRALDLDPNNRGALKTLGDLDFQNSLFKEAAEAYQRILKNSPDEVEILLALGVCFYRLGDFATAQLVFERILALEPNHAIARENLNLIRKTVSEPPAKPQIIASPRHKWPRITVVTPAYQHGQFLEETICSVLDQGYPNLEYIVMDGGSTDGSPEIIRKYARHLAFWQSKRDGGQYDAVLNGFRKSTGEIMTWINSDDHLHPFSLQTVASIFLKRPEVQWLTGRASLLKSEGLCVGVENPSWSRERYLNKDYQFLQQEGTFWRRSLWEKTGATLRTDLDLAGDLELWVRFFRHAELHVVEALLAMFRAHGNRKTFQRLEEYRKEAEMVLDQEREFYAKSGSPALRPAPSPIKLESDEILPIESSRPRDELLTECESALRRGQLRAAADIAQQLVRAEPNDKRLCELLAACEEEAGTAPLRAPVIRWNVLTRFGPEQTGETSQPIGARKQLELIRRDSRSARTSPSSSKRASQAASPSKPTSEPAREPEPENPTALVQRAIESLEADRIEEFETALARALQIDPDHRGALKLLGDLNLKEGQTLEAANFYGRILKQTPDDLDVLAPLGICFFRSGDEETAQTVFERILQLDPGHEIARENLEVIRRRSRSSEPAAQTQVSPAPARIGQGKVSAIISAYQAERFLRGRLQNLIDQSLFKAGRLEIIVIDSASPQNERAVVEQFQTARPEIRYIRTVERETVYGAWNRGISAATGDYVINANADDRFCPEALEMLARELDNNPEVDASYGDWFLTDRENDAPDGSSHQHLFRYPEFLPPLLLYYQISGHAVMLRKSALDGLGLFSAEQTVCGDRELMLRFAAHGRRAKHVGRPIGLYLERSSSLERAGAKGGRAELAQLRNEYLKPERFVQLFGLANVPPAGLAELYAALGAYGKDTFSLNEEKFSDFEFAAELFRRALEYDSANEIALNNLGVLLCCSNHKENGIARLTSAVQLKNPRNSDALASNLKTAQTGSKQLSDYVWLKIPLESFLPKSSTSAPAPDRSNLPGRPVDNRVVEAKQQGQRGNLAGAQTALAKLVEIEPTNFEALVALGGIHFQVGDFNNAEGCFSRACRIEEDPSVLVDLARVQLKLDRVEEFEAALGRALSLDPFHRDGLKLLAELNVQEGRLKDAGQTYAKLLSKHPEDLEVLLALGDCFFKSGDLETAKAVFERIFQLKPGDPAVLVQLAVANLKLGRVEEFETALGRALELDPYHREALKLLADLNFQEGQIKAAAQSYIKLLSRHPGDVEVLLSLGECFLKSSDPETAKAAFERVLEIDPGHETARQKIAHLSWRLASGGSFTLDPASADQVPGNDRSASDKGPDPIVVLPTPPSTPPVSRVNLQQWIDQATFFDEAGNREGALESLKEAVEMAPHDVNIITALGSLYFTLGNYYSARDQFRRLIELRPRDPEAYTRLAMACLKLDFVEEMESALGLALEIDPNNRDALKFLAKTNLENHRVRDAGRIYAQLIEKKPDDLECLLSLGLCFYRGGDPESAAMVYERALKVDPGNQTARENLIQLRRPQSKVTPSPSQGMSGTDALTADQLHQLDRWLATAESAFQSQNLGQAREALQAALVLSPNSPEILSALGSLCFQLGDMSQARLLLQRLVEIFPDDAGKWVQLALTHYQLGEIADFETALARALKLDPNHVDALRLLAQLNFSHGSIPDAAQTYGKILKSAPNDLEALTALGVCFFKQKDYQSAKMMFERVLELYPGNAIAQENLSAVQPFIAEEEARRNDPVRVDPGAGAPAAAPIDSPQASSTPAQSKTSDTSRRELLGKKLAEANGRIEAGDLRGGCKALEEALRMSPENAEILAALGSLLFQLGEFEKSYECLKSAVRLCPDSLDYRTRLALSLIKLERTAEFESHLARVLEVDPNYVPALRLLASLNFQSGAYKDAAGVFHRILRQTPEDKESLLPLGVCFYKMNDLATAKLVFERLLLLDPQHALAKENLAMVSGRLQAPAPPPVFQPLVSAIVSTYKSERFIRNCLEDLLAQTIADKLEIIVIDSASPQNEGAIVKEFQQRHSNIVYVRTEERETIYAAWNRAIRMARGKYVTNANTDDRHRKDAFEVLARKLDQNPKVALVYADVLITDEENKTLETARIIGNYRWLEFDRVALARKGCYMGPQPMWRREVHDKIGYFDPTFISAGDYEFWLRLAKDHECLHVAETLGLYLKSPTSVEHANRERAAQEDALARSRHAEALLLKAGASTTVLATTKKAPAPIVVPPAGRLGSLEKVHGLKERKKYQKAWDATLDAIRLRPFHPDAYLQLTDLALEAGDEHQAYLCAKRLIEMTPKWDIAQKVIASFSNQKKHRRTKIKWTPLPAMPKNPRISVCLIAKNEEKFIGQCLESVKPIATQIVVVDTGSTDRTVEIAKQHGAEVHHFAWNDNFSDARNAAHEHARGDWVLILDADEVMPVESHANLWKDISAANVLGYRIPICNVHESADSVTYVPRLFRNAPALFFVGRVHEQIYASVIARKSDWGMEAQLGTATIVHYGYAPEVVKSRQKVQRNLKLLERAIEEMPDEAALLMNYGLDLVNDGKLLEGLEKYRQAVRAIEPHPAENILPEVRERLITLFGVHLVRAGRFEELLNLMISKVARDTGPTASISFLAAMALMQLNRHSEAIPHLQACVAARHLPTLTPPCNEVRKGGPHHMLAECLARAGAHAEAEEAFKKAATEDPESMGIVHDYAYFLHRSERSLEALHVLHAAVDRGINDERIWSLGGFIANSKPEFLEFAADWTSEAIRFFPEHKGIKGFRGEVLLKAGRFAEALPFLEESAQADKPFVRAAVILCQLAGAGPLGKVPSEEEVLVSRDFIAWYRRLLAVPSRGAVLQVNKRLSDLRSVLPTAAAMLEKAVADASPES